MEIARNREQQEEVQELTHPAKDLFSSGGNATLKNQTGERQTLFH